ncbi:MAG: ribosomal protein large subunit ribosomal protein [Candidatus Parcubacteria bacterium]|jgi:large subunit ribosomal protein L10
MALTKAKKNELLADAAGITKEAKTIVFVKFDKLTVADSIALRRGLRAEGSGYRVIKKTLLKRALSDGGYTGDMPDMPGEIAVAYSADLLAPARAVYEFSKSNKDKVEIMGGVFDGMFKSKVDMLSIATIPPRETLIAQFVNLINSPIQRFAVVVSEIAKAKTA